MWRGARAAIVCRVTEDRTVTPFRQLPFERLPERPKRPHIYFDLEEREVTVESEPFGRVVVRYREHGQGPLLLLIHGLMTSSYSWRYLFSELGARYRMIAPDLVGAGRSDKPDRSYRSSALATFIGELGRALSIRGCDVVGNSLGGYLCMQLALQDRGAMRRLVNIHSPGLPMPRLYALRAALALPGSRRFLSWMIARDPLRWAHRNVHYWDEGAKSLEEARAYGEPLATEEGRAAFARYLFETLDPADMARFAERLAAGELAVPMRLIYARRDPMVPPIIGKRLHRLVPGADLVWLDDCSHFAHVDRPKTIASAIDEYLRAPMADASA